MQRKHHLDKDRETKIKKMRF